MARRPIMVMGCTSDAGKSLLTTALCRYFADRGLRVAPFKAQNMSTNAAVTPDGLEIGRAQYVQALAARTPPEVRMNPVLLKPSAEGHSEGQEAACRRVRQSTGHCPVLSGRGRKSLGDVRPLIHSAPGRVAGFAGGRARTMSA